MKHAPFSIVGQIMLLSPDNKRELYNAHTLQKLDNEEIQTKQSHTVYWNVSLSGTKGGP